MALYKRIHYDHYCSECGHKIEDGETYWDNKCGYILCNECADKLDHLAVQDEEK